MVLKFCKVGYYRVKVIFHNKKLLFMYKLSFYTVSFILMLLQSVFIFPVKAQNIVCEDSHGNLVDADSYLYPEETYHFMLDNQMNSDWKIFIRDDRGWRQVKSAENTGSISTEINDPSYDWTRSYRYFNQAADTCYYKALITSENNGRNDSLQAKLAYLPPRPVIKELSIVYDGYDYIYHELINPYYSGKVYAKDAEGLYTYYTDYLSDYTSTDLDFWIIQEFLEQDNGLFTINHEVCSTYQRISFSGRNKYGRSANSDTILIASLIKDPEILEDLNNLTNGIESPVLDIKDMVSYAPGEITVKSDMCSQVLIYDLQGMLIKELPNPVCGDKVYLDSGIYIVRVRTNEKYLTEKIML